MRLQSVSYQYVLLISLNVFLMNRFFFIGSLALRDHGRASARVLTASGGVSKAVSTEFFRLEK
jgi:hypothetical protein